MKKSKLFEDNNNIEEILIKINEKVIILRKLNFFGDLGLKETIKDFYNITVNDWLNNNYTPNIELDKKSEEELIDAFLDFYNQLDEIISNKKTNENYEDRLGKNLAKKKYFINQAIQNKIANLPPGAPPRTDKQFVNNIEYYQQLAQQSRLSPKTREFIDGVINNIKQNRGLASPKQLTILQKLKLGQLQEITIGPKKYSRREVLHLMDKVLWKVKSVADKSAWMTEVISFLRNEIKDVNTITHHAFENWVLNKNTSEVKIQQLAHILLNFEKKHLSEKIN